MPLENLLNMVDGIELLNSAYGNVLSLKQRVINALNSVGGATQPGLIQSASVTLTNAQIKTLPTIPVEVLASPGVSKINFLLSDLIILNASAGLYTNVDPAGIVGFVYLNGGVSFSAATVEHNANIFIDNDPNLPLLQIPPFFDLTSYEYAYSQNKALGISIGNGGLGNLTGGNAANSLIATIFYSIVTL